MLQKIKTCPLELTLKLIFTKIKMSWNMVMFDIAYSVYGKFGHNINIDGQNYLTRLSNIKLQ